MSLPPEREPIRVESPTRERDTSHLVMMKAVSEYLGTELTTRHFTLDDGTRVEVDGADANFRVFVQVVVNSGSLKSTQRNKAMSDMFKMVWLRSSRFIGTRMIICVSGEAGRLFQTPAWLALAAKELNIEVLSVDGGVASRIL